MNIGEKIKDYRKKAGLTQKQLAEKINRKEITIRKYESGEREPRISIIEDICEALNIPIDEFGEELFQIKENRANKPNKELDLFTKYQSNSTYKSITQFNLINELMILYGYNIQYSSGCGSTDDETDEFVEAINNNIMPAAKVINLNTKEEFYLMNRDITNLFNDFNDFVDFTMFKFKNKSDK